MSNRHSIATFILAAVTLLSSCIEDDEITVNYYDDVAVTAFSLGSFKHTVYTKKKTDPTQDSSYVETISYGKYPFHIDNMNNVIYNTDSLPSNTEIAKALANISVKNSGYIGWKNLESDTYSEFVQTDTIDLSKTRTLRVVANNGSWYKDYTVTVNVHTEGADSLYWEEKVSDANIARMSGIRGIRIAERLIVYGAENGTPKAYSSNTGDGRSWQELLTGYGAPVSMASNGTKGFALMDDGTLYSSEDGMNWTYETSNNDMRQLITASKSELYAVGNGAQIITFNIKNRTVKTEGLDGIFPTKDIQGYASPLITNPEMEKVSVFGNDDTEKSMIAWTKIVDNNAPERSQKWTYQTPDNSSSHRAPALADARVEAYGTGSLLIGGNGINGNKETAYGNIYFSPDNGKNWWTEWSNIKMYLPENFDKAANSTAVINDGRHFWIICGGTGQVWKGHITTFSWQ
ncbi:MAG: DUF6242 domain-containing protein [Bacteroidales bacterium]|nr:DUF6242 domain-containing protein [Bacteroidales bacterium]MCM1146946.1 DUF6242 domain-containing protein [Bacteroidales bacterium]MCM1207007.1 DUF6242 domain-containing protein [Bacillota bacterium]MCM1511439.1 DUF6242 domain-containing protein [Clostridium sp.]